MGNVSKTSTRIAIAAIGMLFLALSAFAQATSEKLDFDEMLYNPCANDGAGEYIHFTGTLHAVTSIQQDNNGCYHVTFMYNPMGLKGVGETTGDTYRGVGNTKYNYQDYTFCGEECVYTMTYTNNQHYINSSTGNSYWLHEVIKVTFDVCNETADYQIQISTERCQ